MGRTANPWRTPTAGIRDLRANCVALDAENARDPQPAPRWAVFLRSHRAVIAAMDSFTVPTLTFGVLYCFFVISHDRRKILHINATAQKGFVDLFRDLFFLDFDGADDGAERAFWMIFSASRCRRCSWNQWVTVLELFDTEEVVGSNPIVPTNLFNNLRISKMVGRSDFTCKTSPVSPAKTSTASFFALPGYPIGQFASRTGSPA